MIALALGLDSAGYFFSFWSDTRARPWAYSLSESTPLLVGRWKGAFVDVDGANKTIAIEIVVPKTEEDRRREVGSKRGSSIWNKAADPTIFKGSAKIKGPSETNEYGVRGELEEDSIYAFTMTFEDRDGTRSKRSFTLYKGEAGSWKKDEMKLGLGFAARGAEGGLILQSKRLPRGSGRQILKEEKGPTVMTDTTIVKRIPVTLKRVED